jgi:hypothetical protein
MNKQIEILSFAADPEKMADFENLTKVEFLKSYSYLTEEEYDATKTEVAICNPTFYSNKNKERLKVTAKALSDGETLTGIACPYWDSNEESEKWYIVIAAPDECYKLYSQNIDPATIEPLTAKVITERHGMNEIAGSASDWELTSYSCPKCKVTISQQRENTRYKNPLYTPNYCADCGQRLDWGEDKTK